MNEIQWTPEQEEVINKMIKESEDLGYVQGVDDSTKELIEDLENLIKKLKSKIFRK